MQHRLAPLPGLRALMATALAFSIAPAFTGCGDSATVGKEGLSDGGAGGTGGQSATGDLGTTGGTTTPDAAATGGTTTPDAAGQTGGTGGGFEKPDAAAVTPDAATVTPDAAAVTPDAAVANPDAAVANPDAAVANPDAAGPPPADAGPVEPLPNHDYAYGHILHAAIAAPGEAGCADHSGDGRPDNSFSGLAALANDQLQASIDGGSLNLLPVSIGLPAGATDGDLAVAVLTGDLQGNAYQVNPAALDANGNPLIVFNPARVVAGQLHAGPGNFVLALPVQGQNIVLQLSDASIDGALGIDQNQGLSIGNGFISGVITQPDLDAALSVVDPGIAALVPFVLHPDIDTDGDRSLDAYSLCLTFDAAAATVNGFPVP